MAKLTRPLNNYEQLQKDRVARLDFKLADLMDADPRSVNPDDRRSIIEVLRLVLDRFRLNDQLHSAAEGLSTGAVVLLKSLKGSMVNEYTFQAEWTALFNTQTGAGEAAQELESQRLIIFDRKTGAVTLTPSGEQLANSLPA